MTNQNDPRAELTAVGLRMLQFVDWRQDPRQILVDEAITSAGVALGVLDGLAEPREYVSKTIAAPERGLVFES